MTPAELRAALDSLGITPYRFAIIARVAPSTVYKWLKPGALVPGYVVTIIELLRERRAA